MSILIDENTRIIVQGITGWQARSDTKFLVDSGVKIVAGVTPGKGGEEVHGVPVYNTVKSALAAHEAEVSVVYVPPYACKDALLEACYAGIKLLVIITENVPLHDFAEVYRIAQERGIRIIGPNCNGLVSSGKCRLGGLGADKPERIFIPGPVGIMSRSGGMCSEIAWMLAREGIGTTTCVPLGGDPLIGSSFVDLIGLFEEDPETKVIVVFGEAGGSHEEMLAEYLKSHGIKKPIIGFIAGRFIDDMPPGKTFGHAGTMIEGKVGSPAVKIKLLKEAGVQVANELSEIPELVKKSLLTS